MGYEQRIHVRDSSARELDGLLRSVVGFIGYDAKLQVYSFRRRSTGDMPDAHAAIEAGGIYFCDNGVGAEIFSDLVRALEKRFGDVVLEEL